MLRQGKAPMLKTRIITAAFLIPATLLMLFFLSSTWFCGVTGLVMLAAAWEWTNLMQVKSLLWRLMYLLFVITAFFGALFVPIPLIILLASAWWLIALQLVIFYPRGSFVFSMHPIVPAIAGIFVLLPCWVALNFIRNQGDGIYSILFLFILIWGADTSAYFVGKKWGKTKLAPIVSPGKSVQGVIGALLFAVILTMAVLAFMSAPLRIWSWAILLSLVTVIFSVVGDLFESMLKRQAGLKDSGKMVPGHGGLLDRIDSLTAAAPIFAACALALSKFFE